MTKIMNINDYFNPTQIDAFNDKIDAIIERSEIKNILTDLEILSQIDAISRFNTKLNQTDLTDTIEKQYLFVVDFYSINDENICKTGLTELQNEFVLNEYNSFANAYQNLYREVEEVGRLRESLLLSQIGRRLNLMDNPDYKQKVIRNYYDIVAKYLDFANNYIVRNKKFEYTVNSQDVFEYYVELEKEHRFWCENKFHKRIDAETLKAFITDFTSKINHLRASGLDEQTYYLLLQNYLIGKFKATQLSINIEQSVGLLGVVGSSDKKTIQAYMNLLVYIEDNIELTGNIPVEINNCRTYYESLYPKSSGSCYIATMAYSDYNHPQVIVLRNFRDDVLNKSVLGKWFIKFYYHYSPKMVGKLKDKQLINKSIRIVLNQFVKAIR